MADAHPLDRPIWSSLHQGWAAFARGDGRALRLDPDYGPFVSSVSQSPADLKALRLLADENGEAWVVENFEAIAPPGMSVVLRHPLTQMVARDLRPRPCAFDVVTLGDADAAEMQALAALTKPGPFARLTHRLGDFIGVREGGKLIAMAGERMKIDGYREVSGVCTDPDHRGRGLAGALMSLVAERIRARGETPFLHSYADNAVAIALYERLGFRFRTTIHLAVLRLDDQGSSSEASP